MSYDSLRKTAEYFEDRARRTRQLDKRERLAAVAGVDPSDLMGQDVATAHNAQVRED
jgi:hypothetical protein